MKKSVKSAVSLFAALTISTSLLTGCSSNQQPSVTAEPTATVAATDTPTTVPTEAPTATSTVVPTALVTATPDPVADLTETQRNSINMLNWLAYLTQEINYYSKTSGRVYIEEVYSLIVNETYPNAVDTHTQERLKGMLQALKRYRMVDVKRERIAYLYEQNKAQAVKAAIPSPLTVMTAVQSGSLARLVTSVVYMAINSVSSYQSASSQA